MAGAFYLTGYGQKARDPISDVHRAERKKPNKFEIGWLLLFIILGLGLTLAVSFSCSSVATSNLHIYSIRPAALIQALAISSETTSEASNNSSITTKDLLTADFGIADFGVADLPDRYLFGISGLCRHWNRTGETKCQRHFPQVPSLLAAVLEDSGSASVNDSWTQLLTPTSTSSVDKTKIWKRYVTAAAGLLITSILWASGTIIFTLSFKPTQLKYSICLDIVDAIMAITAAIMWALVVTSQINALKAAVPGITPNLLDQIIAFGPGFAFLWALTLAKMLVTPLMMLVFLFFMLVLPLCCCAALLKDNDRVTVDVHHTHDLGMVEEQFYSR